MLTHLIESPEFLSWRRWFLRDYGRDGGCEHDPLDCRAKPLDAFEDLRDTPYRRNDELCVEFD